MPFPSELRFYAGFGSIAGLLLIGLLIALGSGVPTLSSRQGLRRLLDNLSELVIRLGVYLAALLAVHQIIGFPLDRLW